MKKLSKLLTLALAVTQFACSSAFAATTSTAEDSYYFWHENFNGDSYSLSKQPAMSAKQFTRYGTEKGIELQSSASGSNFAYVDFASLDFSKPIVISYDVITTNPTDMWLEVYNSSGSALAKLPRLRSSLVVEGYEYNTEDTTDALVKSDGTNIDYAKNAANGTKMTTSAATYQTGKAINVLSSLDYDTQTGILSVKQYFDGKPLLKADGTQYEYKIKRDDMAATMSGKITLRFYVLKNTSARIDNIVVRQDSREFDLPNGSWIDNNQTALTFENTASYSALSTSFYLKALNNVTNNDIEIKKYTADDPFLFDGTEYTGYSRTNYGGSIVLGKLTIDDAANDFYIFKLKNKDAIKTYAGYTMNNQYSLLHRGIADATLVRESHIYDGQGTELYLTDGKFPHEAEKVEFVLSSKVEQPDDAEVQIGDVTAVKSGNVYTVDLSEAKLVQGTEYEITVGNHTKTYTTTGTKPAKPYATAHIQKFDSDAGLTSADKENITLTYEDGKLKYDNIIEPSATAKHITYMFGEKFDFSKGSMLVSFDLTLNQAIAWVSSGSSLFNPQMHLGDKNIGFMPAIEHYGVRGRNAGGGRVAVTDAKATMKSGDKCTISTLYTYYPESDKIGAVQFVDGRRLYNKDTSEIIPEYFVEDVSEFLDNDMYIRFYGRNFSNGGLYIDNLAVTTVDSITADDVLSVVNNTATVKVTSTVPFDQGTDTALTTPVFTNNAEKTDFSIKKYTTDDKLRLNGVLANDVTYDKSEFTFGNLDNSYDYVIELSDTSKVTAINGKSLQTQCFTTKADSIVKTTILDGNGDEIFVDANGKLPVNAAEIKIRFTKDFAVETVSLDNINATLENGEYVFDFTSAPLSANAEYTVKVDGKDYATFVTSDGAFTVSKPIITESGVCSTFMQNTTSSAQTVYIISATYDSDGAMIDVVFEKVEAAQGADTYTMTLVPVLDGAVTQKAFVWNGFSEMVPMCEVAIKTITN